MKTLIILLTMLMPMLNPAWADQVSDLMKRGNEAYSSGHYEEAQKNYKAIVAQGFESAELYYNLGNTYFKTNANTLAIIYYEKAKKLAPNDEDIQFNLGFVNSRNIDKIDVLPEFFLTKWWNSVIASKSADQWAFLCILATSLFVACIVFYFISRHVFFRKLGFFLGFLFLILGIFTFKFANRQYENAVNATKAIIVTPSLTLKSQPMDKGSQLVVLHEGIKVTLLNQSLDWYEVSLPNGTIGWLKSSDIVVI